MYSRKAKIQTIGPMGHSRTSVAQADRYVRRGLARWIDESTISFIEGDRRVTAATAAPGDRARVAAHRPRFTVIVRPGNLPEGPSGFNLYPLPGTVFAKAA